MEYWKKDGIIKLNTRQLNGNGDITFWLNTNTNEEYIKLQNKVHEILDKNENLTWILEGEIKDRTLSNEECLELSELVKFIMIYNQ